MHIGFNAGRRGSATALTGARRGAQEDGLAERLSAHTGEWVAVKDSEVLHAARSPKSLVGRLSRHGQKADSVFRVPEDDLAGSGLAPL